MDTIFFYLKDLFDKFMALEKAMPNTQRVFKHLHAEYDDYVKGIRSYDLVETMRILANMAIDIKSGNVLQSTFWTILEDVEISKIDLRTFSVLFKQSVKSNWNAVAKSEMVDNLYHPYPVQYVRAISLKNWVEYGLLRTAEAGYISLGDFDEADFFNSSNTINDYFLNTNHSVSFPPKALLQGSMPCAWLTTLDEFQAVCPNSQTALNSVFEGNADEIVDRLGFPVKKQNDSILWHTNYYVILIYPTPLGHEAFKASTIHASWGSENMYASVATAESGWGRTVPVYKTPKEGMPERIHIAFTPDITTTTYKAYLIGSISKDFTFDQESLLNLTIQYFLD